MINNNIPLLSSEADNLFKEITSLKAAGKQDTTGVLKNRLNELDQKVAEVGKIINQEKFDEVLQWISLSERVIECKNLMIKSQEDNKKRPREDDEISNSNNNGNKKFADQHSINNRNNNNEIIIIDDESEDNAIANNNPISLDQQAEGLWAEIGSLIELADNMPLDKLQEAYKYLYDNQFFSYLRAKKDHNIANNIDDSDDSDDSNKELKSVKDLMERLRLIVERRELQQEEPALISKLEEAIQRAPNMPLEELEKCTQNLLERINEFFRKKREKVLQIEDKFHILNNILRERGTQEPTNDHIQYIESELKNYANWGESILKYNQIPQRQKYLEKVRKLLDMDVIKKNREKQKLSVDIMILINLVENLTRDITDMNQNKAQNYSSKVNYN